MFLRIALVLAMAGLISAQTTPTQALQGRPFSRVNSAGNNSPENNNQNGESILLSGDRVYAIWADYAGTPNEDIFVAYTVDEGVSWSPMVRVDTGDAPGGTVSDLPQLFEVEDGNPARTLVAFWEDNRAAAATGGGALNRDLYFNRSTDGGQTWMPSALPINSDTVGNRVTDIDRIAVAIDGTSVHVVWEEQFLCNQCFEVLRYARSNDGGLTWTTPVQLNAAVTRATPNPRIMQNDVDDPKITARAGHVAIIFGDDRNDPFEPLTSQMFGLYSPDGGLSWNESIIETSPVADARDLQIARDGSTIVAAWVDTEVNTNGGIRAAISRDDGLTWEPEIVISPALETTLLIETGSQPDVAIEGSNIIVTWGDSRSLAVVRSDNRRGYYSYSNDGGATWTTDILLDVVTLPLVQRPTVQFADGTAFFFYEINAFGANRANFTISRDGGATLAPPVTIQLGSGSDLDTASQHEGEFFVVDPRTQKCFAIFRDRPLGVNEVYVSGVSAPFMTIDGGSDTNGTIQVGMGSTVSLSMKAAPASAGGLPVIFGLSATDSAPAMNLGGGVRLHLVPDTLTFTLLNSAVFAPIVFSSVDPNGDATGLSFPWPLTPGSPALYGAAVVIGANGAARFATDPVRVETF